MSAGASQQAVAKIFAVSEPGKELPVILDKNANCADSSLYIVVQEFGIGFDLFPFLINVFIVCVFRKFSLRNDCVAEPGIDLLILRELRRFRSGFGCISINGVIVVRNLDRNARILFGFLRHLYPLRGFLRFCGRSCALCAATHLRHHFGRHTAAHAVVAGRGVFVKLFLGVIVKHRLDVEVIRTPKTLANFRRVKNLSLNILNSSTGFRLFKLSFLKVKRGLFGIGQRPKRIELHFNFGHLFDLACVKSCRKYDCKKIPQVRPEHPLLNSLDVVVVVLKIGLTRRVHTRRRTTEKNRLRDRRDSG